MPYTQEGLPWKGCSPLAQQTSHAGAVDGARRALRQQDRYLAYLREKGRYGATDAEAAADLDLDRSTINARRVPMTKGLAPLVVSSGRTRKNPQTGVANVVWCAWEFRT